MARKDLCIVDRGINNTSWTAGDIGLTAEDLNKIEEQRTNNSNALNSLPTPFARFYVAKEAFRRVNNEYKYKDDSKYEAGFAYSQMVSDILDVYELLFNLKYYNNIWQGKSKIDIREWNSSENLDNLKKTMPLLYNSVSSYYKNDIGEDCLYFIVFVNNGKEYLLACTSPLTGFVTPADLDKSMKSRNNTQELVYSDDELYKNLKIKRKNGNGYLFNKPVLFENRDDDFKNYMYNCVFSGANIDGRLSTINDYIRSFASDKDIRNDYKLHLKPIQSDGGDLVINGISISQNDNIDINSYFNDTIIKVPFRISRERFTTLEFINDKEDRDYDYLMPFKPEILPFLQDGSIQASAKLKRNDIEVILKQNGKECIRKYSEIETSDGGKIIDLRQACINFDLGIFPNILSENEKENNYFKVFVVAADEDSAAPNFDIDKISLNFFDKDYELIQEGNPHEKEYCILPSVIRSRQKERDLDGGTKYYETFNTTFSAIEVVLNLHNNEKTNNGLLFPKFKTSNSNGGSFTYAIDLGTSNTFISRRQDGNSNLPELFNMEDSMVNYLHEESNDKQISRVKQIESSVFEKAKNKIRTEFLPVLIDGKDYKFPIRTALCGLKKKPDNPKLFDNYNIAFFYEKYMPNEDQNIATDLKWNRDNTDLLRVFIQELLLIIKCDILQRQGSLSQTKIVWFRPLSFMGQMQEEYTKLWKEQCEQILGIEANNISCFSESEAPYYYFQKKNYIKNSDAVSVIDIGGGSTDFVYFIDNKPEVASSVHFGCDVLWENGFNEFDNVRDNGIYNRYKDTLRFKIDHLNELNQAFIDNKDSKTKDIINFWLNNRQNSDIINNISNDFKYVFVYHFTSIIYYMSCMYKHLNLHAPKSIVFSGNGSRYIDNFISPNKDIIRRIIEKIFNEVFGGDNPINIELPEERKESTCYGGLYRGENRPEVKSMTYHGVKQELSTIGNISSNLHSIKQELNEKYTTLAKIYKQVLDLLIEFNVLNNDVNTKLYFDEVEKDMLTSFSTGYKNLFKDKFEENVKPNDSIFFLPIIQKIFELTKI